MSILCWLNTILIFFNYIAGTALILISLYLYFHRKLTYPLYISAAVIIAGPVEDILSVFAQSNTVILRFIDQVTSLGFLLFLIIAIKKAIKQRKIPG